MRSPLMLPTILKHYILINRNNQVIHKLIIYPIDHFRRFIYTTVLKIGHLKQCLFTRFHHPRVACLLLLSMNFR